MPTLPFARTVNRLEPVDEATVNKGVVEPLPMFWTNNSEDGAVVPIPTLPAALTRNSEAPLAADDKSNKSVEPLPWMASMVAPVVVLMPTFLLAVSILNTVVLAPFWI